MGCFLIGKQKVVLFPRFRKNKREKKGKQLGMLLLIYNYFSFSEFKAPPFCILLRVYVTVRCDHDS